MSRHIIAVFTALCFMVMIFASGFGICIIPKTTEILAGYTDRDLYEGCPFTTEQIVRAAVATEDYTMFSNDYGMVMEVIRQINAEAGTPYAGASIVDLQSADEAYTLDARALSHLDDCFRVVNIARAIICVIAAAGIILAIVLLTKRAEGRRSLSRALKCAAIILGLAVIAIAVWAYVDFNGFFTAFHGLFFADGTWTFSYNSLLITMYPEGFWVGMGAIWFVGSLIAGIIVFALGSAIKPRKEVLQ
ncbi:MAG: DUF1461 domain-containing protein [Eggerthellaceae bacterium]|nr:DUF1461 domain-containing protein [Eggerthellaceae bacterium]